MDNTKTGPLMGCLTIDTLDICRINGVDLIYTNGTACLEPVEDSKIQISFYFDNSNNLRRDK